MCRFLLSVMVVALPLVFLWIGNNRWPKWILWFLVTLMIGTSIPYVFTNGLRMMISKHKPTIFNTPRLERYFQDSPELLLPYNQAIDDVLRRGCFNMGIYMGWNDWDYPFWILMQHKSKSKFRIEHVNTDSESPIQYPLGDFYPCAIIAVYYNKPYIDFSSNYFVKVNDYGITSVYINPKGDRHKVVPLRF